MKFCHLWILMLLFSTTACSVVGKRVYYEPEASEKWTHLRNSAYPIAEFSCSDASLRLYSSQVGEVIYTVGPPFVPLFPTFGVFDIVPGEKGFSILVITEGTISEPSLQQGSLKLFIDGASLPIEAQKLNGTYCHQSSIDNKWRCQYYYFFRTPLNSAQELRAEFNQRFNNCSLPGVIYKRQDHSFFYPFILPIPDEHKH